MSGRSLGAAVTALGLALVSLPAAAEPPCGTAGHPLVELVLEVDPPDRIIGTTLEQHLRAELAAREIDVCVARPGEGAQPPAPVAPAARPIARVTLHVEHRANGVFVATVRIGDLIMDKRVERSIDLGRIPADARPLAVAASTDELLRAAWVELTIPDAPPPTIAPPPAVVRAIAAKGSPRRQPPSFVEVGLAATGSDFFGHRLAVGGRAWTSLWWHPRIAVELDLVADAGLPRSSPDGSARADAFGGGAHLVVSVREHDAPFDVRFAAGADVLRVHLAGTASGTATTSDGSQWAGVADLTVRGVARTGPIAWTLGLGAVLALHGVAATDNGATVTSIEGFGGRLDAGLFYAFR